MWVKALKTYFPQLDYLLYFLLSYLSAALHILPTF